MTNPQFDKETTALLVIEPYNDFISEGGKLWNRVKAVVCCTDRVTTGLNHAGWPR